MKKKIIAAALAVSMMTTLAVGMTLAYFTDTRTAKNTFTVGNVKIELTEPEWTNTGSQDALTVYAGEALAKDPVVENTGANPCFVRIKVDGLGTLVPNNISREQIDAWMIKYRTNYKDGELGTNWILHEGYYYHEGLLAVGQKTDALFDQIVMPAALTNGDGWSAKNITVTAEAVQAQGAKSPNFDAVKGMKVEEIAAWFNKTMPTPAP